MEHLQQYTFNYISPVGNLTIASDGESITGLWLQDQKYFAATLGNTTSEKKLEIFGHARAWLDAYFRRCAPTVDFPLAPKGSDFRRAVWKLLLEIPYGETTSYGALAQTLAQKPGAESMSAQAVGGAVGHNPISIIIPCHRVVGKNGSLTGYAGGIDKKIFLLELEGIDSNGFFVPKKGTAL